MTPYWSWWNKPARYTSNNIAFWWRSKISFISTNWIKPCCVCDSATDHRQSQQRAQNDSAKIVRYRFGDGDRSGGGEAAHPRTDSQIPKSQVSSWVDNQPLTVMADGVADTQSMTLTYRMFHSKCLQIHRRRGMQRWQKGRIVRCTNMDHWSRWWHTEFCA